MTTNIDNIDNIDNVDIIIVTTKHCISIAINLMNELKKLNLKTIISGNIINCDKIHILLASYKIDILPKKYIIYQLEQIYNTNNLSEKLWNDIKNSVITFDYSIINYDNIPNEYKKYIRYQPIPIINKIDDYAPNYEYDILFFGSLNDRRIKIINYLINNKYNVVHTCNTFYEDLYKHIRKAKIVLNLHFYEDSILETARINELLEYKTLIISETCNYNNDNIDLYKDDVFFINNIKNNLLNINVLINKIDYCLKNFDILTKNIYERRTKTIEKIYNNYTMYLKKNLIDIKLIKPVNYIGDIYFNKILCIEKYNNKDIKIHNNKYIDDIQYIPSINNIINMYYILFEEFIKNKEHNKIIICSDNCILPYNYYDYKEIINNIDDNYDILYINDIEFNIFSKIFASKYINYIDNNEIIDDNIYNIFNIIISDDIIKITINNNNIFNNII